MEILILRPLDGKTSLLDVLIKIFNDKARLKAHVTIRASKTTKIDKNLEGFIDSFRRDVKKIEINGVGQFLNGEQRVVFLNVKSKPLKKQMRKSDFLKKDVDANPHITIYKGNNSDMAKKIEQFLEKMNREISYDCQDYRIMFHKNSEYLLQPQQNKEVEETFYESNFSLANARKKMPEFAPIFAEALDITKS